MPLKISIDVDGTLLGESGQLVPGAETALRTLKDKGHQLQLWSLGGAEYAEKVAKEHRLTAVFESYATKPDVAIDDLPETASPSFVLNVNRQQTLVDAIKVVHDTVEECVESVLCPSLRVQDMVAEMQGEAAQVREDYGATILRRGTPLHPVPFFGNIEGARFVTIGLNPSSTEFDEWREWPQSPMPVDALTHRLVNYFRLAHNSYPPPHKWFSEIIESSHIIGCPHKVAYAHIDFCPWTTLAPTTLRSRDAHNPLPDGVRREDIYWQFLNNNLERWFERTVGFCRKTAKLVIILHYEDEWGRRAREKILEVMNQDGHWNGQIVFKPKAQLQEWAWPVRSHLRSLVAFPRGFA